MIPKCIAEQDAEVLRSIILAEQVRAALKDMRRVMGHVEQLPALANELWAILPDNEAEHKAIIESLPNLSDEQITWLMDNVQASYMRFRVVEELLDHRPHLK